MTANQEWAGTAEGRTTRQQDRAKLPALSIRRSTLICLLALGVLLLGCWAYWRTFAMDLANYEPEGRFRFALNSADHEVYAAKIKEVRESGATYELTNDLGIALIYLALAQISPFGDDLNGLAQTALIFNCAILCLNFVLYASICDQLRLGLAGKLTFFVGVFYLYFAQMMNKDMLTIMGFLLAAWCGLKGRVWPLLLLLPAFVLVRQQLAVFAFLVVVLFRVRQPLAMAAIAYVAVSLAAGILWSRVEIISAESVGDGFNGKLLQWNRQYYVGYLIGNPIRLLQYIWALVDTLWFVDAGGIDVAKLLRVPQIILLMLSWCAWADILYRLRHWMGTPLRWFILVTIAYCLAWLMNPTVNSRYVMLITPILVLMALSWRRQVHEERKNRGTGKAATVGAA